jgi:lysophospholipase L1-like esterase
MTDHANMTQPPINEYQVEENDLSKGYSAITRLANITAQYAAVVREIATENKDKNVVLIDLWTALMNAAIKLTPDHVEGSLMLGSRERSDSQALRHFLADGLHLTGAGYSVFLTEVSSSAISAAR